MNFFKFTIMFVALLLVNSCLKVGENKNLQGRGTQSVQNAVPKLPEGKVTVDYLQKNAAPSNLQERRVVFPDGSAVNVIGSSDEIETTTLNRACKAANRTDCKDAKIQSTSKQCGLLNDFLVCTSDAKTEKTNFMNYVERFEALSYGTAYADPAMCCLSGGWQVIDGVLKCLARAVCASTDCPPDHELAQEDGAYGCRPKSKTPNPPPQQDGNSGHDSSNQKVEQTTPKSCDCSPPGSVQMSNTLEPGKCVYKGCGIDTSCPAGIGVSVHEVKPCPPLPSPPTYYCVNGAKRGYQELGEGKCKVEECKNNTTWEEIIYDCDAGKGPPEQSPPPQPQSPDSNWLDCTKALNDCVKGCPTSGSVAETCFQGCKDMRDECERTNPPPKESPPSGTGSAEGETQEAEADR